MSEEKNNNNEEMKESPFLDEGEDFTKSTTVDGEGKLQKAIPTMESVTKKVMQQKKQMPKGFDKFKKEVEDCFKLLDDICKEIAGKLKPENTGELLKRYKDFKQEFKWRINDFMQYPAEPEDEIKTESEYAKNRINI